MKAAEAIAEILKREGIEMVIGYPVNHILEFAARADIRPIIVRQERVGLHMADAISRLSSGKTMGVAQAYGESVPILVMPQGYARRIAHYDPNFNSALNFRNVTKTAEPITSAAEISNIFRRAFTQLRSGRGRPVLVEVPTDIYAEEVAEPLDYKPVFATRSGPDPLAVEATMDTLLEAERPVIYAGQGIHYAEAWDQLRALAEHLAIPVVTSLEGKSAFPEDHPLALGSGGRAIPKAVHTFLQQADLIFGIGCSFTETNFGVTMPLGKTIIHSTLDPVDINKDVVAAHAMVGDAALTLDAMLASLESRGVAARASDAIAAEIAAEKQEWLNDWMPKLTSEETPLSPYRVLWDLHKTVDRDNTIITHDAGSPRDQISPFWESTTPLSYIGWGKTTQLGYGLGLAMGAKLACPDKLCINVWGDAAIGFTGMDFETAVRERIPILSILLNNFSMAIELKIMPVSTEKYRSTDISGDYAAMARAFGGYGERVSDPAEIIPAIKRGIEQTEAGTPALLEFITGKETDISTF